MAPVVEVIWFNEPWREFPLDARRVLMNDSNALSPQSTSLIVIYTQHLGIDSRFRSLWYTCIHVEGTTYWSK